MFQRKKKTETINFTGDLKTFRQSSVETTEASGKDQKDVLFEFGKMAMSAGTHSKALSYFRKMVALCESEKETYVYLIQIHEMAKKDPDILEHYRELLSPVFSMKEDQADVLFEFGKMAMNAGDHKKARSYFDKMVPLCDDQEELHGYLRQIREKAKKDPDILGQYTSLLAPLFEKGETAESTEDDKSMFTQLEDELAALDVQLDESRGEADTEVRKRRDTDETGGEGAKNLAKAFRKALKK